MLTKCVAITVEDDFLIIHEFESELAALFKFPFIKKWSRETFDKRYIRYHSKLAEKYWANRKFNDKIKAATFTHGKDNVQVRYD